jgi:sugar (pentulose or hexulose) kinase
VPAAEVTSLGAQTQLWDPRRRNFSSLVDREDWAGKFPPLRHAWEVLGPLQFETAERCELPKDTPVLCGIHDSNANFARYLAAGLEDFTLISTGTWLITFNASLPLDRLTPLRDTVSNTDLLGRPVACARFMGGREYARIAGEQGLGAAPQAAAVEALIARGTMALPAFSRSGGPFPGAGGKGRIVGPAPTSPDECAALASLYVALMASVGLDLLESTGRVIVDGSFAENRLFAGLLAALRPDQAVAVSTEREGTALGAALLWGWTERTSPVPLALRDVAPLMVPGLGLYAADWRAAADQVASA